MESISTSSVLPFRKSNVANRIRPPKAVARHVLNALVGSATTVSMSCLLKKHPELTSANLSELLGEITERCLRDRIPMVTSKVIDDGVSSFHTQEWLMGYVERNLSSRMAEWIVYTAIMATKAAELKKDTTLVCQILMGHVDQLYCQN